MKTLLEVLALVGLIVALIVPTLRIALERRSPQRDVLIREHLLERYVITLTSGEAFDGLLAAVDDRTVVLRDVTVLSSNSAKVGGEIELRRESIAYLQRP